LGKQKLEEKYNITAFGEVSLADGTITIENDDIKIVRTFADLFSKVDKQIVKISISKIDELEQ